MKEHPIVEFAKKYEEEQRNRKLTAREIAYNCLKVLGFIVLVIVLSFFMTANGATVVFQVDGLKNATVEEGTNFVLKAGNGIRLVGRSEDWQSGDGVVFNAKGSGALPLRVEASNETSGKYVKTLFVVVTNAPSIKLFESIVASKERFRIGGRESGNTLFNAEAVVDAGAFTIADWSVNLQPKAKLSGGARQMITIVFKEPQKLEEMQFGGEGRPEWGRGFRGGFLEFIAVSDTVSEPVHEAVAHYFRLKHGLPLDVQSTPEGRAQGSAIGVNFSGKFATIYSVR